MERNPEFSLPRIMLDRSSPEPLHRQLSRQIAEAIRSGEIDVDARLPSTRVIAKLLSVSRNTALLAYDDLVAQDLIRGERGSGMRINGSGRPTGIRAVSLRGIIRRAGYPARTVPFTDPDGNPLYLNF